MSKSHQPITAPAAEVSSQPEMCMERSPDNTTVVADLEAQTTPEEPSWIDHIEAAVEGREPPAPLSSAAPLFWGKDTSSSYFSDGANVRGTGGAQVDDDASFGDQKHLVDKVGFGRFGPQFTGNQVNAGVSGDGANAGFNTEHTSTMVSMTPDRLSVRTDVAMGPVKLRVGGGATERLDAPKKEKRPDGYGEQYRVVSTMGNDSTVGLSTQKLPVAVGGSSGDTESVRAEYVFETQEEADAFHRRMDSVHQAKVMTSMPESFEEALALPVGTKLTRDKTTGQSKTMGLGTLGGASSETDGSSVQIERLANGKIRLLTSQTAMGSDSLGFTGNAGAVGSSETDAQTSLQEFELDPEDPAHREAYRALLSGEPLGDVPGLVPTLRGEISCQGDGLDGSVLSAFKVSSTGMVCDAHYEDSHGQHTRVQSGVRTAQASLSAAGQSVNSSTATQGMTTTTKPSGERVRLQIASVDTGDTQGTYDQLARAMGEYTSVDGQIPDGDAPGVFKVYKEYPDEDVRQALEQIEKGHNPDTIFPDLSEAEARGDLIEALKQTMDPAARTEALNIYLAAAGNGGMEVMRRYLGPGGEPHVENDQDTDLVSRTQLATYKRKNQSWEARIEGGDGRAVLKSIESARAEIYGMLDRIQEDKSHIPENLLSYQKGQLKELLADLSRLRNLAAGGQKHPSDTPLPDETPEEAGIRITFLQMNEVKSAVTAARSAYERENERHRLSEYGQTKYSPRDLSPDAYDQVDTQIAVATLFFGIGRQSAREAHSTRAAGTDDSAGKAAHAAANFRRAKQAYERALSGLP